MEGFITNGGSDIETVSGCFNKFTWCEDMVEKGFMYVDTAKEANKAHDGFIRFVHIKFKSYSVREVFGLKFNKDNNSDSADPVQSGPDRSRWRWNNLLCGYGKTQGFTIFRGGVYRLVGWDVWWH